MRRGAGGGGRRGGGAGELGGGGDGEVVVRAGPAIWRARAAIAAAGPWSGRLLGRAGIEVPLAVTSQTVAYLGLTSSTSAPPAVVNYDGDEPFALWDPVRGLKTALHARGPLTDPDGAGARPSADVTDRLVARAGGPVPRPEGAQMRGETRPAP